MLLTKSRVSVVAIAIISLLLVLAFALLRQAAPASASNAGGTIPSVGFGDTTVGNVVDAWDWKANGADMNVYLLLSTATWANKVFGMEVFIDPIATSNPVTTQYTGGFGPFPTGQTICFSFTSSKQPVAGKVGIHLIKNDQAKTDLLISPAPLNTGLLNKSAPCIQAESDAPTPTPTAAAPTATPTPKPTATVAPSATPTPTTKPPVTGDFTPGSGTLMGLLLAGFVLMTAGSAYLLRTRRARD